jgi:hypothetical protein
MGREWEWGWEWRSLESGATTIVVVAPGVPVDVDAASTSSGKAALEASAVAVAMALLAVDFTGSVALDGLSVHTLVAAITCAILQAIISSGPLANSAGALPLAVVAAAQSGAGSDAGVAFFAEGGGNNTITAEEGVGSGSGDGHRS